ncbi:MAG: hypothetical protein ABW063_10075, partial [Caulobacter sp.]
MTKVTYVYNLFIHVNSEVRMERFDQLFIGGEWVAPVDGSLVESIDPATGKPWAVVAMGGPKD